MNKREFLVRGVLAALPVLTAGVALSFTWVAPRAGTGGLVKYAATLTALALVLSVEALWLYHEYFRVRPKATRLAKERDFLRKRVKFLEGRLALLQKDVETLSAMRQVARAAAAHDVLDRVFEETVKVIQDLVDADWVTVFIRDDKSGLPIPRAHRSGGVTYLGKAITPGMIDDTNVREALEFGSLIKQVEGDRLLAAVPAVSGGSKLGVVAVSAPLAGSSDEKSERVESFESALKDIAETIAYSLRAATFQTLAYEDDLTGLGDRGLFDKRLSEVVALSLRKNQQLSLALMDIDFFKRINDTHGHQVGDEVLRELAALLTRNLRRYDTAYRYGGEELALLLPQTGLGDAVKLAERLRFKIEKKVFSSKKVRITVSFGVAALGGETLSETSLVAAADTQLYKAKSGGRNRVEPSALRSRAV